MQLELESGVVPGPVDDRAIELALGLLGTEGGYPSFAILSRGSADQDHYVQASIGGDGFIAEKREGHVEAHFMAMRLNSPDPSQRVHKWWQLWGAEPGHDRFTLAEIIEIFRSFVQGSEPTFWRWVPLELSE